MPTQVSRINDDFWTWRRAWARLLVMAFGLVMVSSMAEPPTTDTLLTVTGTGTSVVHNGKGSLEVSVRIDTNTQWHGRLHKSWVSHRFTKNFIDQRVEIQFARDPVFSVQRIYGVESQGRTLVDPVESIAHQLHNYRIISILSALAALAGLCVGWLTWHYPGLRTR